MRTITLKMKCQLEMLTEEALQTRDPVRIEILDNHLTFYEQGLFDVQTYRLRFADVLSMEEYVKSWRKDLYD